MCPQKKIENRSNPEDLVMLRYAPTFRILLAPAALVACQTTVNLTDASAGISTEASSGNTGNNSGDTSTDPSTSGAPETTGAPDGTTGGTTGKPNETTSTSGDSTGKPGETSTTGDTTGKPGDTTTTGDTSGGVDTTSTDGSSTGGDSTTSNGTTGGGNGLDGWTKYREVLIDNGLPTELKDFQVAVDVKYDADMSPDYSDLRFTDASGTEILPYWIEWDTGPVNAYIWVRVPVIAADDITTIRVYYGNPNAASASDGLATFLFFDDFEAPVLDAVKWKTTAPVEVSFGRLLITKGAVYTAKPAESFQGTRLEARLNYKSENASQSTMMASQGQVPGNGLAYAWHANGSCILNDGDKNVFQGAIWSDTNKMLIYGVGAVGGKFYYHTNRTLVPTVADSPLAFPYYISLGHGWGKAADMNNTTDLEADWVLVRRFVKTEPMTFVGGEKTP